MSATLTIKCDMCGKTAQGLKPHGWYADYVWGLPKDFCSDTCYEEWQERVADAGGDTVNTREASLNAARAIMEHLIWNMHQRLRHILADTWQPISFRSYTIHLRWCDILQFADNLETYVVALRAEARKRGETP